MIDDIFLMIAVCVVKVGNEKQEEEKLPKGKKKKQEREWKWTISQLADLSGVSDSYLHRLCRNYRLFKDADGFVQGRLQYNVGTLISILPNDLKVPYTEYIRKEYGLKPTPKIEE